MTTNKQAASEYLAVKRGSEPCYPHPTHGIIHHAGLNKREMFAMAAMQGILSSHADSMYNEAYTASLSMKHADALLAQLSKEPQA